MFREIILPIFRNTRLCVTVCGIMHPRCCRPATSWVHYTTSCNTQSSAPEYGRDQRPKYVELSWFINKPLLSHLVGCLYYFKKWTMFAYSGRGSFGCIFLRKDKYLYFVFPECSLGNFTKLLLHVHVIIKVHYCLILYYGNKRHFFFENVKCLGTHVSRWLRRRGFFSRRFTKL